MDRLPREISIVESLKVGKVSEWQLRKSARKRGCESKSSCGGRYTCRIFLLLLPSLFLLFYLDNNSEINSNQTYFIINRSTRQLYRSIDPRIVVLVHSSDYIRPRNSILFIFFFKYTIQVKKFLKKAPLHPVEFYPILFDVANPRISNPSSLPSSLQLSPYVLFKTTKE